MTAPLTPVPSAIVTLRDLIDRLRLTYAGKIGVEFMHCDNPEERNWFLQRLELGGTPWTLDAEAKGRALMSVINAEGFESFLENRFKGHKRFSLEGGESTIAVVDELLDRATLGDVDECVIGMAHRGRLTMLANVIGKGIAQVFTEFEGEISEEDFGGSGDVKYHLGASNRRQVPGGKAIRVSVAPNPSHLEAVNPVVEGIVRPKQDRLEDKLRERVIPLLIHGDAAMAGQGIVAETLNLSQIDGYNTGGTIHLIVNNQIGFTTNPSEGRSTGYSSDVALMIHAPVFHVNGDDPEACTRAAQLAYDYRQRFHRDVVIDVLCWRKHGHNEGDDASYTQPVLYRQLKDHKSVAALYGARLQKEGVITAEEIAALQEAQKKYLYEIYDLTQTNKEEWELLELSPLEPGSKPQDLPLTGASLLALEQVLLAISEFPAGFKIHPKLARLVEKRAAALRDNSIDWALAETLAFGSLMLEGTSVRLSGQDVGRGTFSHRHATFHDYETDAVYVPLAHLVPGLADFEVYNSPLSEYAVVGFEFGYSVADPFSLVVWEAQYGDFANGAQIMIDQFIASAESKWGQPSGLVMLLPHGQEGGGSGTFQRSPRALPAALRRIQYSSGQLHHSRAVLPSAAPPDARRPRYARLAQASDRDVAEKPAASSAGDLDRRRSHQGRLPARSGRRVGNESRGHPQDPALQRQSLLRSTGGARGAQGRRRDCPAHRHRAHRTALSLPRSRNPRRDRALQSRKRRRVGSGRTEKHGSLALHAHASATHHGERSPYSGLRGTPGERIHRPRFHKSAQPRTGRVVGSSLRAPQHRPPLAQASGQTP